MMLKKLATITIFVKDQNETLRFFTEKLGFEVRDDVTAGDYRWLTVGLKDQPDLDLQLAALKVGGAYDESDIQVLTKLVEAGKMPTSVIKTDNCQKAYDEMAAKGVEFAYPPTDRPYGIIEAMFKDSNGNRYVLSQDKK
ncbi:MAG: VOC family protein [Anaerolineae bacterium]|nr:VOC family protein [Anaerolineae bacterium]